MRPLLFVPVGLLVLVGGLRDLGRPSSCRPGATGLSSTTSPRVELSCKPSGPLEVRLHPERASTDGSVELAFDIRPVLDMMSVSWRLEVPSDAAILEGLRQGEAAAARDVRTRGRVRVRPPVGRDRAVLTLVVEGVFQDTDVDGSPIEERVEVERAVAWGELAPVAPVVEQLDPLTGEIESLAVLPSVQAGRRSGEGR